MYREKKDLAGIEYALTPSKSERCPWTTSIVYLVLFCYRKSRCGPHVTSAGGIGSCLAPPAMARKSHYTGTSSLRNSVPYAVCNVMKTDWSDVTNVLTSRNE